MLLFSISRYCRFLTLGVSGKGEREGRASPHLQDLDVAFGCDSAPHITEATFDAWHDIGDVVWPARAPVKKAKPEPDAADRCMDRLPNPGHRTNRPPPAVPRPPPPAPMPHHSPPPLPPPPPPLCGGRSEVAPPCREAPGDSDAESDAESGCSFGAADMDPGVE